MTEFSQEPLPQVNPAFRENLLQLITWANETYRAHQPERCENIIRHVYRLWDGAINYDYLSIRYASKN